jgi:hypothetical protein
MKNRHLFQFKLKPEAWDFNTSIPAFRQMCEEVNAKMTKQMPDGVTVTPNGLSLTEQTRPKSFFIPSVADM